MSAFNTQLAIHEPNQSSNQSVSRSINQSTNQSNNLWISHSQNQPTNSTNQPNLSTTALNQFNQSTRLNLPANQWDSFNRTNQRFVLRSPHQIIHFRCSVCGDQPTNPNSTIQTHSWKEFMSAFCWSKPRSTNEQINQFWFGGGAWTCTFVCIIYI